VAGAVLGIVLYAPVLSLAGSVPVSTASGHISYQVPLLMADSELARFALKLIYFVIIVGSLGVSSDRRIQVFGGLIALSLIATELWFADAFVSVWCFFAAVLSLYISAILLRTQASMTGHQELTYTDARQPQVSKDEVMIVEMVLVAGAGFEPATFRL
jgi:hypothetical protein